MEAGEPVGDEIVDALILPLVDKAVPEWELIGVTSGPGAPGVRCGEGPGLYTSAPAYAGWIRQATGRHG